MPRNQNYVLCINNRSAEDLELRKLYRALQDNAAAADGYVRVIDESGEDYLYPAEYFVFIELPEKAKRAWTKSRRPGKRNLRPVASARNR
jgi:hypothetical protein